MASIFVLNDPNAPIGNRYTENPVRMFTRTGVDYAAEYLESEWKNLGLTKTPVELIGLRNCFVANSPAHLARVMTHLSAVAAVNLQIESLTPSERERYAEELDVASIGGGCGFWVMPKTAGRVLDRIYTQRTAQGGPLPKGTRVRAVPDRKETFRPAIATARNPPPRFPTRLEGSWIDELTDFPPRVTLRWRCRKDGGATHVHGRKGMDLRPIMKCPNCGGTDWYVDKSTTRKEDGTVKTKFWGKPTMKMVRETTFVGKPSSPEFRNLPKFLVIERVDAVTTKEELAESLRKKFVPGRKFATWEEIAAYAVSALYAGGKVALDAKNNLLDVVSTKRLEYEKIELRNTAEALRDVRAQLVKKAAGLKEATNHLRVALRCAAAPRFKRHCQQWLADYDKDPER